MSAKKTEQDAANTQESQNVLQKMLTIANDIYKSIIAKEKPELEMPLRNLQNVTYNPKEGYFVIEGKTKERTLQPRQ